MVSTSALHPTLARVQVALQESSADATTTLALKMISASKSSAI